MNSFAQEHVLHLSMKTNSCKPVSLAALIVNRAQEVLTFAHLAKTLTCFYQRRESATRLPFVFKTSSWHQLMSVKIAPIFVKLAVDLSQINAWVAKMTSSYSKATVLSNAQPTWTYSIQHIDRYVRTDSIRHLSGRSQGRFWAISNAATHCLLFLCYS